ncbi:Pentatricopeptide repeat-containing protein [Actinidia chinensis var. chinensis]|uniref:Pentatricopeptide repeat-containing protein n=1 Tax=Actinidia chinensis var. chinensis TaxID=1590841 RepID=A0A2R6PKA6_ACTCC|nr:Pentatricopeptide repeat-containing protein [Actinidia chinensis var. chinensis]
MLSKAKPWKLIGHWRPRKITKYNDGIYHAYGVSICNSFCNMTESPKIDDDSPTVTESPELPVWLKFSEKDNPMADDPEDDFVLPTDSYWAANRRIQDQKTHIKHMVGVIVDSDVDRISKILKNQFQSPDDVAQSLNGCSVNVSESLVEQMLKRFSNDWIQALGFFKWTKSQTGFRHSADLYNSMVDVLGKCRRFDLMWELVEDVYQSEGYISLIMMTKVFRRLAKAQRYNDAIEAFRKIERFGVNKDVLGMNALMDALMKENSVEHAQDVYLEFKNDIPPNSHTFNVLIHGWCKVRQAEKARDTMEEMEKHGFLPDVISYTCFIELYCREKDFRKVDGVLEEMQEKGCPPNVVTYTIVMHALGKAKEINEALKVYDKMIQRGCVPDSSFYSSLIYILSKAGRLKDAREVFEDMSKQGVRPDMVTYNTLITAACEHSQEEIALKLLREMDKSGCKPDLRTYAPLLKMFCRKKRMKVVLFLLKHMFGNDVSLELGTYSLLVRGLCKSGKIEHACLFFEEMVSRGFVPKDCTSEMLRKELERKGMVKAKARIDELILQARSQRKM